MSFPFKAISLELLAFGRSSSDLIEQHDDQTNITNIVIKPTP
jgi:hypothetical protein